MGFAQPRQRGSEGEATEQLVSRWPWGGVWHLAPEPASTEGRRRGLGRRLPPCAGTAPLLLTRAPRKSCSQKGGHRRSCVPAQPPAVPAGHQKECCFQPWAPQPTSQNAFWHLPRGSSGCSCSGRCWLPVSPGNPGVLQVSVSASEQGPPARMHVAGSAERSCVPPWWEDNDGAGFYGA